MNKRNVRIIAITAFMLCLFMSGFIQIPDTQYKNDKSNNLLKPIDINNLSETTSIDYIDQPSDVDSSADIGTHSDFTYQQSAPDSVYDTLTEGIYSTVPASLQLHLNESSGLTAYDSSAFGNDGTLTNMDGTEWTSAKLNNGLLLDGLNDYITLSNTTVGDYEYNDAFSVECWFYTTLLQTQQLVSKMSLTNYGWKLYADFTRIKFAMSSNTPYVILLQTDQIISINTWYHVIMTYDGSDDQIVVSASRLF